MKKVLKILFVMMTGIAMLVMLLMGILVYEVRYRVTTIDENIASDGVHSVKFQEVGEAVGFGSSSVRLVLSQNKKEVAKVDLTIANDGKRLSQDDWQVIWDKNRVEVIVFGEEQSDQLWMLDFSGEVYSQYLSTHYGKAIAIATNQPETKQQAEDYQQDIHITEGMQKIFQTLTTDQAVYEEQYDAKGNPMVVVSNTDTEVCFLKWNQDYNDISEYVYFKSTKKTDGSWDWQQAAIITIFQYHYQTGEIIDTKRTTW